MGRRFVLAGRPAAAATTITAVVGRATAISPGQRSIGCRPPAPRIAERTRSVAAGIVAVAQMGSSSVAVPAVATHAGSAAVGIAPWRRAASRRRGVAGITRSESSAIEVSRSR